LEIIMPKVSKLKATVKTEKRTKLQDVKPGEVIRFPFHSYEQAIAGEEGAGFHMVIDVQPKKTGRVNIVSSDGKLVQEKDGDHEVIVHPSRLEVGGAEFA
jgi:hypothetical protein